MANAETNFVPKIDHFDNQSNTTQGSRKGSSNLGTILAEFFRKERQGREALTAAGSPHTVTFAVPYADANYNIQLTASAAAAVPIALNKTATTFQITIAADATVYWNTKHD